MWIWHKTKLKLLKALIHEFVILRPNGPTVQSDPGKCPQGIKSASEQQKAAQLKLRTSLTQLLLLKNPRCATTRCGQHSQNFSWKLGDYCDLTKCELFLNRPRENFSEKRWELETVRILKNEVFVRNIRNWLRFFLWKTRTFLQKIQRIFSFGIWSIFS